MNHNSESYRSSHTDAATPQAYDRDFWVSGTTKHLFYGIEREWLEARIQELCPETALDFACGTGRILSILEANINATTGVDISPGMATLARERCASAKIEVGDLTTDPTLVAAGFDLITSFRFFLNAEEQLRRDVLAALRERLNPGGALIANFHLNPHSLAGLHVRLSSILHSRKPSASRPMLGLDGVKRLLGSAGFEVEQVRGYGYVTPRLDQLSAPRLQGALEARLARLPLPASWAENFLVLARKKG